MKVGILTFHWATNYGAVLQCYALQEYLRNEGHEVEIINYKPRKFDFWFKYLKRPWLILRLRKDLITRKKEEYLALFRNTMLKQTDRYHSTKELRKAKFDYDVIISGSDQVLNPSYTIEGEDYPTSAYYLEPFTNTKRIGYAVSFGCVEYPIKALPYSKQWINCFDRIGVREDTGMQVLEQMEYKGISTIVPDPTILFGSKLFSGIKIEYPLTRDCFCVYILRKHVNIGRNNVIYIDDYNNPLPIEKWIGTIINCKGLITNSYHGMIVAILNHVPFVALADSNHMNDRFVTILSKLGMLGNMITNITDYETILERPINWTSVDERLNEYQKEGMHFLDFENQQ